MLKDAPDTHRDDPGSPSNPAPLLRGPGRGSSTRTISPISVHSITPLRKISAFEVRRMPKAERERYMLEHTAQAAKEYALRPELLIDGGSELIDY